MPAVAGRPAGPSGSLCHVAATKTKQKEGKEQERERENERERKKERLLAAAVQRRSIGGRGWRRVNSGEILLVSVKDGPWSALVSWRRRGFNRASPVPNGGGGK